MILETMPEVRQLSSAQKRMLAEELWTCADAEEAEVEVADPVLRLLNQRLAEHEAHPDAVSAWDAVNRRVFAGHDA